ncbi:MAG: Tn3 family transposase [Terriglobia bacterium]
MARIAASLRNRTAPANVIIQRLANASSSDRLARALTALGQIAKSIFILRYLDDEKMRDTVKLQLNHREHRHDLTRRCLFFANRGGVSHRRPERNYEQSKLPEPALECRSGLEHSADRWDR